MADIRDINGNRIVLHGARIDDGTITDEKLANGGVGSIIKLFTFGNLVVETANGYYPNVVDGVVTPQKNGVYAYARCVAFAGMTHALRTGGKAASPNFSMWADADGNFISRVTQDEISSGLLVAPSGARELYICMNTSGSTQVIGNVVVLLQDTAVDTETVYPQSVNGLFTTIPSLYGIKGTSLEVEWPNLVTDGADNMYPNVVNGKVVPTAAEGYWYVKVEVRDGVQFYSSNVEFSDALSCVADEDNNLIGRASSYRVGSSRVIQVPAGAKSKYIYLCTRYESNPDGAGGVVVLASSEQHSYTTDDYPQLDNVGYWIKGLEPAAYNGGRNNSVFVGGSGYATIKDAVEGIDSLPCNVYIQDGTYTENDITLPDGVNLIGLSGDPDKVIINGVLPNTASDTEISETSTINISGSNRLVGLTVTAKNMRYPVHSESANKVKNWVQEAEFCKFIHYGNHDVVAYRNENGLDSSGVWRSTWGYGEGGSSGGVANFKHCLFRSHTTAGYYYHDASNFTKGVRHTFEKCTFDAPIQNAAIMISANRNNPDSFFDFVGCSIGGYILDDLANGELTFIGCNVAPVKHGTQDYYFSKYPRFTEFEGTLLASSVSSMLGKFVYENSYMQAEVASNSTPRRKLAGFAVSEPNDDGRVRVIRRGYYNLSDAVLGSLYGVASDGSLTTVTDESLAVGYGVGFGFVLVDL